MCSPSGACAGSALTTTLMSRGTSTAFPTASRAARWRCGSPAAPWRSSSRASGSLSTCDRAAMASTRPLPTICRPVIAVTPTGLSAVSAGTPPSSGRQPSRSAILSWSTGRTPSRASDPASASCGWRGRSAGSRRHACHRDRCAHLRIGPFHPRPQTRSIRRAPACCGRRADPPFQHPRLALLPIGDQILLTHPTLDLLHQLGLNGMAKAFGEIEASAETTTLTHPEWLALLLDQEVSYRRDRRLLARLRYARLRHQAAAEDVDYRAARGLDRALFQKLAEGSWIDAHENLILCGPTGVGKSWLASALGHKACRDNRSVLYQRIPKLFADLTLARGDGRYARLLRALGGVQLLILDDWGLEPLDATARHDLLEILEERYGRRSTIITSQIPLDKWHELIGDPTYADAILDRIVHNAHRINLTGHSLRRARANKASKD